MLSVREAGWLRMSGRIRNMKTKYLDIYTNSVEVSASLYEIVLDFRLNTPTKDGVETERLVKIRMSPPHAKALNVILSKHFLSA